MGSRRSRGPERLARTLNLYTATIAAPGRTQIGGATSADRSDPDVEAELAEKAKPARIEAETRKQVAIKAAEQQRAVASRADTGSQDKMADAIGAAKFADTIEVPLIPRLVADDVTLRLRRHCSPSRAVGWQSSQPRGIFDIIAGRYSGSIPNMDLWLRGIPGDSLKGRPQRPATGICSPTGAHARLLMIQPAVLSAIAANREFRGRGILARILYACPVSKVGWRTNCGAPVDPDTQRYEGVVVRLASEMAGCGGDRVLLTLTPLRSRRSK